MIRDDSDVTFRDVITLMWLGMTFVLVLLIFHLHPKSNEANDQAPPAGNITVEVIWPDNKNVDIDLWSKGPEDLNPIGYSNRSGKNFSLVRDDIGFLNDSSNKNYENAFCRGLPDGTYAFTVHMYSLRVDHQYGGGPVPVTWRILIWDEITKKTTVVDKGTVILNDQGQELSLARFTIENSQVVEGTLNHDQVPLRGAYLSDTGDSEGAGR